MQILLAAGQRCRFAKLEAGIHPPQSRERCCQRCPNEIAWSARGLQKIWIYVRRVDEQMRAKELLDLAGGDFDKIVGQLLLCVTPSEIGIRLRKANFRQPIHHFWAGEGLRKKNYVCVLGTHLRDQPFPERQRFSVRIIDAKESYTFVRPEQDDVPQR